VRGAAHGQDRPLGVRERGFEHPWHPRRQVHLPSSGTHTRRRHKPPCSEVEPSDSTGRNPQRPPT
jgi:hypothetical protein